MSWEPTHYFRSDGSPVRFITDDPPAAPGYVIVDNEDDYMLEVRADELDEIQ